MPFDPQEYEIEQLKAALQTAQAQQQQLQKEHEDLLARVEEAIRCGAGVSGTVYFKHGIGREREKAASDRSYTGESWDHPRVTAFSEAVTRLEAELKALDAQGALPL